MVPTNFVFHSKTPIKLDEIGATTEQHVLAVIHHLAGAGMLVGRGTSPEKRAALKQRDLETAIGEGATGGQPGQAATYNSDLGFPWRGRSHHAIRFEKPRARTVSFSLTERVILPLKTS